MIMIIIVIALASSCNKHSKNYRCSQRRDHNAEGSRKIKILAEDSDSLPKMQKQRHLDAGR